MASPRWLVTGGSGQVGGALAAMARAQGIDAVVPTRGELDLADPTSIRAFVAEGRWDAIINCGAYTVVDKAESEPDLAQAINAVAPGVLAQEAAQLDIPILHVSTDYVFDGTKVGPYTEDDPVRPLGVYGRTKEEGEQAVRASGARHAILRTAWVVSAGGANFVNTMLRLGAQREELGVVDDQYGCPTHAGDIAAALMTIARDLGERSGTWHFVNGGEATWHGLAARIFAATAARGLPTPRLNAITTADYPTPARRPANSRLATEKIATDFGIRPRHWHDAIDALLAERLDGTTKDDPQS